MSQHIKSERKPRPETIAIATGILHGISSSNQLICTGARSRKSRLEAPTAMVNSPVASAHACLPVSHHEKSRWASVNVTSVTAPLARLTLRKLRSTNGGSPYLVGKLTCGTRRKYELRVRTRLRS